MKFFLVYILFVLFLLSCQKPLSSSKVEVVKNKIKKIQEVVLPYCNNPDYQMLKNVATISDLIILCDETNPILKSFAYTILAKKKYSDLKGIYVKHKKDKSVITYYKGSCNYGNLRINEEMLSLLNPDYKFGYTLSEYNQELNMIAKINK